ncbi:MAG: HD domain-containing protein [Dysgonamonadaceae bacterium]|nr:HD domain-containing protein [Dysgonamonadaceae bacterium]
MEYQVFVRCGGTQVFVTGFDDHVRTRLTHTLEVSQIAKTIAESLQLNQTLNEAIAFAHDLGHTPFGHIGERTLNHFLNGCDVFKDFNTSLKEEKKDLNITGKVLK